MKRYSEYKDSGVEWIGEVPIHWKIMKTSLAYNNIGSGTTPSTSNHDYYDEESFHWLQTGDLNDGKILTTSKRITNLALRECNLKLWPKGSVVVAMYGATIGKVGLLRIQSATNQACCVMPPRKIICSAYSLYVFLSGRSALLLSANGGGQPNISQDIIKKLRIPIPPLSEQQSIASYLDKKCGEIDKIITTQQKRIALLEELKQTIITHAVTKGLNPNAQMKDSGVEWIGEVQRHWEVVRLKNIVNIFGRIGFRGYTIQDLVEEGKGAITLSPSNMKNGIMDYQKCSYLSWFKYYESPEIIINNGDILFVKTGSTFGKTCLVKNLPMEATINPQLVVFKQLKCDSMYLSFVLKTEIIQEQVRLTVGGSTIPTLSQGDIMNYLLCLPPLPEQKAIATYLDKRCASIDASIQKANHEIELLQEYKQSLITEVVTGKRKVC